MNFTLYRGDKIGLLGANGSGKTTLAKLIAQEITPTSGDILIPKEIDIGYFSQTRIELDDNKTLWEFIGEGQDFVHINDREVHVITYLEQFLFSKDMVHLCCIELSR